MTTALAAEARDALKVAGSDPALAADLGAVIVARARAARDHVAWSIAERAMGLAAYHNEDLDAALGHLRAAISQARRCGATDLAAQARMTLAFVQTSRGRSGQGLREIDSALADLHGVDRARGQAQRAGILLLLGRLDEALAGYAETLPVLRAAGDWLWVWRVLSNRAVVHGQRLELAAAETDLRAAAVLCQQHDLRGPAAYAQQNLGWIASLAGDVPAALSYLDDAERRLRALGSQLGEVLRDRAELLLSVYLAAESRTVATAAVEALEREHRLNVLPEARLLLARAARLDHDPALALAQARRAAHEFRQQDRADWLALAQLFVAIAGRDIRPRARIALPGLERVAETLEAARWPAAAVEAWVVAGDLALARGHTRVARGHWDRAGRYRAGGPATVRARAWYATALSRWADGNGRGATSAARVGLRIVDEYRFGMGATDLLARTAGHRTDLARLGLRLAVESGRPGRVLEWAERGRASRLGRRSVRPPDDPVLRTALAELRAAAVEVAKLRRAGQHGVRAQAQLAVLERQVRDQFRRRRGDPEPAEPVPVDRLAAGLDGAALVEFVEHDGYLYALTLTCQGLRLRRLAGTATVADYLDRLPFALRRVARHRSTVESRAAAAAVLADAAARLDVALFGPLAADVGAAPLVLVPTGRLQSVPWSILPSCTGRPTVVAPSAAAWYRAARPAVQPGVTTMTAPPDSRVNAAVVAGPELPGAVWEATAVAALHDTEPLLGAAATADAVLDALRRAELVHLAAHGRLSAENPLFSALTLADGPLMVYDLEGLDRVPSTVVLAACDSGRHVTYAGDELLGLAATLLARGTRQLVGSVIPVPDIETAPLMVDFHRLLAGGRTAARALADVQRAAVADGGAALAAAAAFVCVGADLPVRAVPVGISRRVSPLRVTTPPARRR
jgi:tetratricopeptide (TPR) repeat protein